MQKITEAMVLSSVSDWLGYHKFDVERINRTPIFNQKTGTFRKNHMTPGISDLWYYRHDATGWIECKSPKELAYIKKHYQALKNRTFRPWSKKKQHFHEQILFLEDKAKLGMITGFVDGIDATIQLFRDSGIIIHGEFNFAG